MHIWHVEGKHSEKASDNVSEEERLLKQMIEGVKNESEIAKYKDFRRALELYTFHNSEAKVEKDRHNECILCHGDVPHSKKKEIRAFLNMHAFFLACETCHIQSPEKKFVWYNKINGKEDEKIDIQSYLGNTEYKLTVLKKVDGKYIPYATKDMKNYISEYIKKVGSMTPTAKSAGLKLIHKPLSERPVLCDACHTPKLNEAYLPYVEIGYPESRISRIIGNEVVGMIDKYKEFYLPEFLKPETGE